jgi:2-keto-4-pentenoate hydratase
MANDQPIVQSQNRKIAQSTKDLARDLVAAYAGCLPMPPPSSTLGNSFDLAAAYAVEAEVVRLRRDAGHTTVGRKVGFANRAMWRILKLETLVWARMYDDTVHYASSNQAALSLAGRCAPRIEPEIVFKLKQTLEPAAAEAATILEAVEWMALGFEINDCVFPEWKFQPADFVAAFGFHTALIVGDPQPVDARTIPAIAEQLPRFALRLSRNGEVVDEGSGKNALRSPALCLGELASAIARQPGAEPLEAGEIISTGTLTTPHPVAVGETWLADCEGLDLAPLRLQFGR